MAIAQLQTTLPLYLTNFAHLSEIVAGSTFVPHLLLLVAVQLPVARWIGRCQGEGQLSYPQVLLGATSGFALAMLMVLGAGLGSPLVWALVSLSTAALAIALYNGASASLVVQLAPESLRGVYLSVNSLCWAVGYAVGPLAGGAALDLPRPWADCLWLGVASILMCACWPLLLLDKAGQRTHPS